MNDIEGGMDGGVSWPVPSTNVLRELEPPTVDWPEEESEPDSGATDADADLVR
jgi:hypothetical protein